MTRFLPSAVVLASTAAMASLTFAATATPAAGPASGQLMSMAISTLAVVALIIGAAWLLKRIAPRHYARNDTLRVVAGAAVGQRERVVVVEISGTWLVLGVAPGQVNLLHNLPRAEAPVENAPAGAQQSRTFAQWLMAVAKK